jgi:hypothetical protein
MIVPALMPVAVAISSTVVPSRWLTLTCARASSGGTEYWLPRKETSAWAGAVR